MYSEIYLRLEPLGLERVAQAVRMAGHEVRILDLQVFRSEDYFREIRDFQPQAIGFSLNYLANVPEVIDLVRATRDRLPQCFIFVGGLSGENTGGSIGPGRRGLGRQNRRLWQETLMRIVSS
jgi:magnesium-protoporphyrin IX monomethyl ester (oxidative) cyclase